MSIRVAIVEDHDDFREGLAFLLEGTEGFDCVGKYSSVEALLKRPPDADFVLMDIGLPGASGIQGVKKFKAIRPKVSVLMMTVFEDAEHILDAIMGGADGYLLKKTPPARILQSIEEAAAGGLPMTPVVARHLIEKFKRRSSPKEGFIEMTKREKEILSCLVDGLNYAMTGEKLFISIDTVRNHIRHIYDKLHVHSRTAAVAKALRQNLL